MSDWVKKMKNCAIALYYPGNMHNPATMRPLESIVHPFPSHLQSRWGEAEFIIRDVRKAKFEDITDYVDWRAEIADWEAQLGTVAGYRRRPPTQGSMLPKVVAERNIGQASVTFRPTAWSEWTFCGTDHAL